MIFVNVRWTILSINIFDINRRKKIAHNGVLLLMPEFFDPPAREANLTESFASKVSFVYLHTR